MEVNQFQSQRTNQQKNSGKTAQKTCFGCNRQGHYKRDCPQQKRGQQSKEPQQKKSCHRCGRTSHLAKDCRAKRHISGKPLEGNEKNRRKINQMGEDDDEGDEDLLEILQQSVNCLGQNVQQRQCFQSGRSTSGNWPPQRRN